MKARHLIMAILGLVIAGSVTGCQGNVLTFRSSSAPTTRGSGNMITETRDVRGFDAIDLQGSGDVDIRVTGEESLIIEAEDNIMPLLKSEVNNGTLELGVKPNNSINTNRGWRYILTVKDLSRVNISGSGDIKIDGLDGDFEARIGGSGSVRVADLNGGEFHGQISGSGTIRIDSGTVTAQDVTISGSGSYDAPNLESQLATVSVSGSGNATINVVESLDATLSGSGSVYYDGEPHVTARESGSGKVQAR